MAQKVNMNTSEDKQLKIAVPNKGRLTEKTLKLLQMIGLEFDAQERSLITKVRNAAINIMYVRASDIPEYVQDGVVELGITGLDLIGEKGADVKILRNLGYGNTELVVAVPEKSNIKKIRDLRNKNIATSYPALTEKYLKSKKIKANIIEVDGAVEITPLLGLAEAITDLVSTGTTLRANKLTSVDTILVSEAVLLTNKKSFQKNKARINSLLTRIDSVLIAQNKLYIMMNAPENKLEEIKNVAPGLSAPTIMKLTKKNMIAIHSVINRDDSWRIIEKLKQIGATGILIMPIERMLL